VEAVYVCFDSSFDGSLRAGSPLGAGAASEVALAVAGGCAGSGAGLTGAAAAVPAVDSPSLRWATTPATMLLPARKPRFAPASSRLANAVLESIAACFRPSTPSACGPAFAAPADSLSDASALSFRATAGAAGFGCRAASETFARFTTASLLATAG